MFESEERIIVQRSCGSVILLLSETSQGYLQFDYFRKKEQVRMIKEALSGLLNQDVEVKRVMVGEPYTEEGEG